MGLENGANLPCFATALFLSINILPDMDCNTFIQLGLSPSKPKMSAEIRNGGYKNVAPSDCPTDRIGRRAANHCVVNLRFVQMMMIGWHAGC